MVERPQARRVDVGAGRAVGHDRIVGPAVPQPLHHVDELGRALVAAGMVGMGGAEIVGALAARGRDGVPGGAPLADMVERGEDPRHRPGIVVGRRHGGAEADAACAGGQRRQHGHRLQPHRVGRVGAGIGIEIVAHEDEVEPAALGDAGDLLHLAEILEARHRPGMAPARDVAAGAEDEQPEMHLPVHEGVTVGGHRRRPATHVPSLLRARHCARSKLRAEVASSHALPDRGRPARLMKHERARGPRSGRA